MLEDTAPQANEISLRDYVDLLRRRKAIVLQTFVVVFVVGLVVTFLSKPLYRTSARLLVEGKQITVMQMNTTDPLSNLFSPPPSHDVATQIEVLQGEKLLADAFKEADVPPGAVKVEVKQVGDTDVIEITTESMRPLDAERLAKTLPATYLRYVTGNRQTEVSNALLFAQNRLKEENEKLVLAEIALQRFKERARVANLENERNERITQTVSVEGKVREAEAIAAGIRARLDTLLAARSQQPAYLETPTTITNPAIEQIKEKIATLTTQRASLLVLYKPNHARIQEVDAQIHDIEQRLANAPATITTRSRTRNPALADYDAKIADQRAALSQAQAELGNVRARAAHAGEGLNKYSALERQQAQLQRDVERHQGTVAMLGKSVQDLSIRKEATHNPVTTVTPAGPAVQVAPRKLHNLLYAALVGLVLGLCFALLQEFLDDRINAPEEARRILAAPALGYVPLIEKEDSRLLSQARGGGSILESYRVLRSNVQFAAVDAPVNSLLVTSTAPGEGKSVTASNLAVAMALDGRSVILVDSDLRRPTIHEKFGLAHSPGLTNVLVGQTPLDEALQATSIPNLRVLSAGPPPPNPAELLNSRAMHQLHESLKQEAEFVIFDSPPCLATADAQVLSAETDGVLYVVQFGEAKKSAVRHASELLRQAHARVLGVVFNKIDLTGNRDDYYYGYYRYYDYYHSPQLTDGSPSRRATESLEAPREEEA